MIVAIIIFTIIVRAARRAIFDFADPIRGTGVAVFARNPWVAASSAVAGVAQAGLALGVFNAFCAYGEPTETGAAGSALALIAVRAWNPVVARIPARSAAVDAG